MTSAELSSLWHCRQGELASWAALYLPPLRLAGGARCDV